MRFHPLYGCLHLINRGALLIVYRCRAGPSNESLTAMLMRLIRLTADGQKSINDNGASDGLEETIREGEGAWNARAGAACPAGAVRLLAKEGGAPRRGSAQ